jgi:hypothetical protein
MVMRTVLDPNVLSPESCDSHVEGMRWPLPPAVRPMTTATRSAVEPLAADLDVQEEADDEQDGQDDVQHVSSLVDETCLS